MIPNTFLFIDFQEILVIGLIVVVFFGADKLPEMMRTFGKTVRTMRDATDDIKKQIMEPVEDITKEVENPINTIKEDIQNVNPVEDIQNEITEAKKTIEEMTGPIARK